MIALALSLLVAACGRSSSTTARNPPASSGANAGSESVGDALAQGKFGGLGVICHPATDPKMLKASDVGVTANSIGITTFSDPGYAGAHGLNQEMFDTATAFTNWCNQHLGIDGRKINVNLADGTDWQAISLAGSSTAALKTDGTLWTWGPNSSGQLGDGTTVDTTTPHQAGIGTRWATLGPSLHRRRVRRNPTMSTGGARLGRSSSS